MEYGLYFVGRIRNHNFTSRMFAEAIGALQSHITNNTLSYCKNPILLCVLVLEQLQRAKKIVSRSEVPSYEKIALTWEQIALAIDKQLVHKFERDLVFLYIATDIRGRTTVQLIRRLRSEVLMMTKGMGLFLEYGWDGPYRYNYRLLFFSSILRFILKSENDGKLGVLRRKVPLQSFKAWVMRPGVRFFVSFVICVTVTLLLQFEFLKKLDNIGN